jgi:hypothetical protein
VLEGRLAVAIWLPLGVVEPVTITSVGDQDRPSLVPITLVHSARVWVPPPGELAMPDEQMTWLRQADLLLHAEGARDDADRRRPPHRDPDENDEHWRLLAPASLHQQLRASGTLPR